MDYVLEDNLMVEDGHAGFLMSSIFIRELAKRQSIHKANATDRGCTLEFCASKGMFHWTVFSSNFYMQVRVCLSPFCH